MGAKFQKFNMSFTLNLKKIFFDSIKAPNNFFQEGQIINYVDIGASNVKNLIFYSKFDFLNVFLFEPDQRAITSYLSSKERNLNLKIFDKGLWKNKGKKYFYQFTNQASSSFFQPNLKKLSNYNLGVNLYHIEKKILSEVDSLDRLLINYNVDFIKLDTEGADYEILLGAKKSLNQCLGIVIESQFFERYLNTKSFSEIEILMRKKGFEIFMLNIEKWSQDNFYNIDTNIKNVWADVLYFISIESLIKKLKKLTKKNLRVLLVKKIIFLMVMYKMHDSSLRYLKTIRREKLITENEFIEVQKFIKMNINSNFSIIIKDFFRLIICLILLPSILIYTNKYIELFKYCIEKNLRNFKRLVTFNLKNKSIFRNTGLDIH